LKGILSKEINYSSSWDNYSTVKIRGRIMARGNSNRGRGGSSSGRSNRGRSNRGGNSGGGFPSWGLYALGGLAIAGIIYGLSKYGPTSEAISGWVDSATGYFGGEDDTDEYAGGDYTDEDEGTTNTAAGNMTSGNSGSF
jgi:hypothetical protein